MPRSFLVGFIMLAGVLVTSTGCDAIFGDGYDVSIEMNNDNYFATDSTDFIMNVQNHSDNVVYYLCGGEVFLEHVEGGDVEETRPALPNCDCLCPSPIEAGASERREFHLDAGLIQWMVANSTGDESEFRFRLKLYEDTEFEHELDLDDQRSTEFRVSVPQTHQ